MPQYSGVPPGKIWKPKQVTVQSNNEKTDTTQVEQGSFLDWTIVRSKMKDKGKQVVNQDNLQLQNDFHPLSALVDFGSKDTTVNREIEPGGPGLSLQ